VIVRFTSDRHPTPVRMWFLADAALVIATNHTAAVVLADRPCTADTCADLATALTEAAYFLRNT
jgi:hypothetical protein